MKGSPNLGLISISFQIFFFLLLLLPTVWKVLLMAQTSIHFPRLLIHDQIHGGESFSILCYE